jgi:hypothetical protein
MGCRVRFQRPYIHKLHAGESEVSLTLKQAKFEAEGFASTGVSRILEHHEWLCLVQNMH